MPIVDDYLDAVARAPTANQQNGVLIQMEIHCAPVEVCDIIDGARDRGVALPPTCVNWHALMDRELRMGGRAPQPYVRTPVSGGATLYASPGAPDVRAKRTLVIAFTGIARRLMMPIALFLQGLPADRYEVLLLIDSTHKLFFDGIQGLGTDLSSAIGRLRARVDPARYRRTATFGTSGGGLAAVWAAIELGADRAVSIGGPTPEHLNPDEPAYRGVKEGFVAAIRARAGRLPEVLMVSGDGNDRDIEKARQMSNYLPSTHLSVVGCQDHNVLFETRKRGRLDALLDQLLGERSPSAIPPELEPLLRVA